MTPIAVAAAVVPVAPYQLSAALPFESSETNDAALERRFQQQQQQQQQQQHQQQSTSVEEPSSPSIFTGISHHETRDNTDPNLDILAIQLDDLTIETIHQSSQSATGLPSASATNNSAPEPLSVGVTAQRMGLAQNVRDHDRDRDLDSERTTGSTPSALLLAQPLSLTLDEDQSQHHFLSSDPILTPLQRLRASTPLGLEHPQDYPVFAHGRAQHQAQYNYTISNAMDYTSDIPTITPTTISNSNNNINNNTSNTNNNSTIQASINNNRIGQDIAMNEHISEPTHSYQSSIFTTMEPQGPYPSDTRLALNQVLNSFQGAIIDHAFDHFAPQAADTIRVGSNSTPVTGSMTTLTDDARSATTPAHMLAPSEMSSLGADESLDMSNGNLSTFPRAALPRRSSAAVDDTPQNSSNFVAVPIAASDTAETPFAPTELRLQPSLAVQADQEETPMQREQVANSVLGRAMASMTDSLSSAAAEAIISSTLTDPTDVAQESQSVGHPASIEIDSQATQPGPTLHIPLEPLMADRLDLLGPLLSGTHNAPLPPPSEETLGFSLLGSSGRRIQGFDSSILSMASRIRQARLARVLRLMGERDPPMAYPDRYQWGRFAPTDTRSMVNHASVSRGTSRAGSSVEENQADQNLESESRDLTEDGRSAMRHRDAASSSRAQPSHNPSFTEILDCNGNPLDSSNESYASSSSASSMTSYDALDDRDEDMDWMSGTERRRRRRTGWDDPSWNRGAVRGQGRSRVVSTGTAFEGMEYISQADNLLNENGRYRSLKASWMTNPNGESWSDDEGDDPQRRHQGQDHEDKDPESTSMRRDPPSLGMLPPHNEGSSAGGFYYIYGNVRNRYGPDSVRRRRVMSDMTVLLRREQEWERELEQYDREMAEFQMGGFHQGSNPQVTRGNASVPRISMIASTPGAAGTTLGSSVANAGTDGRRTSSNDESISGAAVSSNIDGGGGGGAPTLTQSSSSFGSVWPRSGADVTAESRSRPPQEFGDYEQGHSHYHAQGEMTNEQDRHGANGLRRDHSLLEVHRHHLLQQTHSQQQLQREQQSIPSQSITHQSTVMNRTPPLLPAQPLVNEPIAHQIRRAHNSHIMGLQRRWEMQQQQQQQRLYQLEQAYLTHSVSGDREQDRFQRYPGTTFVPPPSRQQPQNHPNQSLISTSSAASSLHVAVPMEVWDVFSQSSGSCYSLYRATWHDCRSIHPPEWRDVARIEGYAEWYGELGSFRTDKQHHFASDTVFVLFLVVSVGYWNIVFSFSVRHKSLHYRHVLLFLGSD
ncbi:hypothetical protein KI688_012630 [Linnemannia hyalina]|uniref:Uncharacterized protein n=1 Tax=Linnemannia hyalina TaxID=64524 RepID=A0A9P7XVX7_9FUNG|nr:hypothetical protein KI688_012630 [Linnemannia hyalina]